MADRLIRREKDKPHGMSARKCLHLSGVSESGYYRWRNMQETQKERQCREQEEFHKLAAFFRKIIARRGYVPGKRTFRVDLWREFNVNISVKKCREVMERMNLTANRPKKDAYKHQATHDHEAASPENKVKQDFFREPRKVILTDITYLYYGPARTPIYLCAFKDAYTKEILGNAVQTDMTVNLVKAAYDDMMAGHRNEFRSPDVYIHSDQGSQYLSTTFRQMLEDDCFIQSVSGRGNSQDNAPMESFFGRMKTGILDLVALCPDSSTAARLISGYIGDYNTTMYQDNLAGLTPEEFFRYCRTGIYPLDNYHGVRSSELRSVTDLVNERMEARRKKAEKARKAAAAVRASGSAEGKSPLQILTRDRKILNRQKKRWEKQKKTADNQIRFLDSVLEKTVTAGRFFSSMAKEEREKFRDLSIWKDHPELAYVYDMKGLF